ncbi:putative monocarboxylate transporter, partial [Aureobasidium melanogenum]
MSDNKGALGGLTDTVGKTGKGPTDTVGNTVQGVGKGASDTVNSATKGVGDTTKGMLKTSQPGRVDSLGKESAADGKETGLGDSAKSATGGSSSGGGAPASGGNPNHLGLKFNAFRMRAIMAKGEGPGQAIELQAQPSSASRLETEFQVIDHDESLTSTEHSPRRRVGSSRKMACVLLGSAVLQFPIWGFAMSYGVFQEYYIKHWTLQGSHDLTGIIGMTSNGVMYLSMPFLFALFTKRWAGYRQTAALLGTVIACVSYLLSSFSTNVWHLVFTQGVFAAFGSALVFSPMTLSLALIVATSDNTESLDAEQNATRTTDTPRTRKIPWHFLHHRTIYIYSVAIVLQSAGYGIPQTYLNTYASEVAKLSQTSATLLLTLFNIPGIASSSFFGYLSENKHFTLSATTVTCISGMSSALSAFLLWGLTTQGNLATLVLFSITFGFFAGGYSATWGGLMNDLESEARQSNEAIDSGMVYGLLNGARGIGYVAGGLVGVPLLKAGTEKYGGIAGSGFGVQSSYGPLIIFTGLASVFGGWGALWKWKKFGL